MATPATAPQSSSSGLRALLLRHPLFSYFFMAYAFSWVMTIPVILSEWGYLPKSIFIPAFAVKAFAGPFLAAFIMVNLTEGKEGLQRFRRRFFQTRAGWQWYLFILLAIPALVMLGLVIQPGVLASYQGINLRFLIVYLVNFIVIFFLGGPLAEEPGWRGFALPRVQQRYGPLRGALFLGLIWAFWHLPDFLTSAQGGGPGTGWTEFFTNLPIFVLLVVAINILITWTYNHTQGSLFIAILFHASINTSGVLPTLFPTPDIPIMTLSNIAMLAGLAIPALLVVLLTRGRLGYVPESDTVFQV